MQRCTHEKMQANESDSFDEFPKTRKRGRPKKNVDISVMFHMLKNNVPITVVARHLGIHRDTIYTNFRPVIDEAREAWRKIIDERYKNFTEKIREEKRLKEASKRKKRRYRGGYFNRWRPRPR